jgi:phospholipase C
MLKRLGLAAALSMAACGGQSLNSVNHIVVIYLENHSFDNLYGEFAGAEGLSSAAATSQQIDANGAVYASLPQPVNTSTHQPDSRFPANLPNTSFNIDQYLPAMQNPPDLVHRFYHQQLQIDGGKMDRFAQISDAAGLVMGTYHTAQLPLAAEARNYTLCDHFFHAAFGGSFLNHVWLIAAASPTFPGAPANIVAQVDAQGNWVRGSPDKVTQDYFGVNTLFTVNTPHPSGAPANQLMPNQTIPTIGDDLTAKGLDWAWYAGGWNNALAGNADPSFQFHHQPFAYFANYADGTPAKAAHLKDETDFIAAAQAGKLPPVSFVKPLGTENEHPGYANVIEGENHTLALINAVRNGPNWKDSVIVVTYDENGGFWDHVPPPKVDRWGPGTRVPTIVISPFAKRGFVDKTVYDTTSILALIEHRYGLKALSTRDAAAADLTATLSF